MTEARFILLLLLVCYANAAAHLLGAPNTYFYGFMGAALPGLLMSIRAVIEERRL